ncbi:hypothetical protein EFW57_01332 [Bacillus velezensis]|nr:hypothetical protein EFW57_01332 [Bacillus velezensis]
MDVYPINQGSNKRKRVQWENGQIVGGYFLAGHVTVEKATFI